MEDDNWQLYRCVIAKDNLPVLIGTTRSQSSDSHLAEQLEFDLATAIQFGTWFSSDSSSAIA
ncbi:MAG: hypothetical protein ABFS24_13530 [Pseudomonadota bacterium]